MVGVLVITAVWAMLPAYIPNNIAVVGGGSRPIDGGRTWAGRRILGDGKTWRGTVVGIAGGFLLALGLNSINESVSAVVGVKLPVFSLGAAIGLATGAMAGDIGASFLKRRSGRERGASFPGLDQLDFVIGALCLAALVASDWFATVFTLDIIAVVVVLTPLFHVATNVLAYGVGLKAEPW